MDGDTPLCSAQTGDMRQPSERNETRPLSSNNPAPFMDRVRRNALPAHRIGGVARDPGVLVDVEADRVDIGAVAELVGAPHVLWRALGLLAALPNTAELRHGPSDAVLAGELVHAVQVQLVGLPGVLEYRDTILLRRAPTCDFDQSDIVLAKQGKHEPLDEPPGGAPLISRLCDDNDQIREVRRDRVGSSGRVVEHAEDPGC